MHEQTHYHARMNIEEDEVNLLKLRLARRDTTVANILRIKVPVPLILLILLCQSRFIIITSQFFP